MNNHKKSLAYSGDKIQDYHKIQVCIFRFLPFCDIYKFSLRIRQTKHENFLHFKSTIIDVISMFFALTFMCIC